VSFWLPSIIAASGVTSTLSIGLLTAIPYLCGLAAMILVARSSDARRGRRWHLAIPAVVGAVGLVLSVIFADSTTLSLAAMALAAAGILTCIPQFYTLPPAVLGGAA